ncbi:efflux RND transporter permease subunit [Sphingomonas immobilis]|uniref:Efflux RND transporter permease subunit n=1 Tax=Sphingomonas immobilis TaxID=3063997 RepID=A0ABT9A0P7_9SPHN|nr:efflux RND transporter permease subunit [Sphingomonas sp. CA1-15]MDO7843108.1 efflux RND transporter permease subunit [Sphingomonas sp. CA1-15]
MGFRNISAWSIRNPVPSLVLFMMLTVAGLFAFATMPVNNDPDIDFPVVVVIVSQPGAAPTELENQVTQKVEAGLRSLPGVDEINSTVTEGQSQTLVQLAIGTNIDRSIEDIRSAIQQVRSSLPDGILEPQVIRIDSSGNDLASYAAVTSDMTVAELSWYIDNTVTKELQSVPGMSTINRNGGVDREIRVKLDAAKLQSLGLTASQVNQQLRQVNMNAAGGRTEIAGSEQSVRVLGNAADAYALGQTQISVGNGRMVRLTDIATVLDQYAEQRTASQLNGHQVVTFDFQRAKGASDVAVFAGAKAKLEALETQYPKVKFQLIDDSVKYTEIQYHSAIEAMIEGALLAVVVVFIFLRDWRATAISALAIPLSAIPTFWIMQLLGFTLNQMTLLALSLVAGVLVDDAIVEIENIVRHMRMGKSAYQASIDAADEIGIAVLATTMSIVAVFLPVGLMPGVSGQFFKNFGLTVVSSVLISLAVARLITPMIAAYFLRAQGHASHGEGRLMDGYMGALRWTLMHRWSSVVAGAVALGLTVVFFAILPQSFQPDQDHDSSTAVIELAPGTTLDDTQKAVAQVADILKVQPDVASIYSRVGIASGRVTATFKPKKSMTSVKFERNLAPTLAAIPDARVSFRSQQGWGSSGRDITVVLGGEDPQLLTRTAQTLVQQMSGLKSVTAPRIQGDLQQPELEVRPRFDLAANLGVTTAALSSAVRLATLGDIDQNKAKFSIGDRQVPITVALEQTERSRMATIQNLPVPTITGGSVPLSTVADIGFGASPSKIERVQLQRQLTVGADLGINPRTGKPLVSSEAWKEINALPIMKNLPMGVRKLTLGQAKWQGEMIKNFIVAVFAGIFLVFAVLILLYRRILPPFVNMGSLLLAPLGGLIALWIAGMPISMPVYIGLLMLLGIVAKNSILLIDFALEEMQKGVPTLAAIEDAGHKRAQPIVMTTVAMVAGMVPTALSLSGDGSFRAPMGVVVIGGLSLSTILTLLIVPATFSLAMGIEGWLGPRLSRRLLTYRPGDDGSVVIGHEDKPVIDNDAKPAIGKTGKLGYKPGDDEPQPAE